MTNPDKPGIVERLRSRVFAEPADTQRLRLVADEAAAIITELVSAGQRVLDGLNARIDEAPDNCVPLFDGIAELHDALARARS